MDHLQELFESLVNNFTFAQSFPIQLIMAFGSSYWIWGFLFSIVVLTQALSLGEKVWIMVCLFLPSTDLNLHVGDKDLG